MNRAIKVVTAMRDQADSRSARAILLAFACDGDDEGARRQAAEASLLVARVQCLDEVLEALDQARPGTGAR